MRRVMGEFERMYFQWARGRAMVARRSMLHARIAKARGQQFGEGYSVTYFVERARRATRDWRKWRARMLEAREAGI